MAEHFVLSFFLYIFDKKVKHIFHMRRFLLFLFSLMAMTCANAQYYHYGGRTGMRPVMLPSIRSVRQTTIVVVKNERHQCQHQVSNRCSNCGAVYGEEYSPQYQGSYNAQEYQPYNEGNVQQEETCVGWTINFDIGSFSIATNNDAHTNILNIVNYAKKYPNAIFNVYGYADANTGGPQTNMRLAEKRCDLICSILINGYNIEPSRINKKAYGSNEQIYRKNKYNRCVYVESFK